MLYSPLTIPPCAAFWQEAARLILQSEVLGMPPHADGPDLSAVRVVVPTFAHGQLLREALAAAIGQAFIPPRIVTLDAWIALLPPMPHEAENARVISLYAELRRHAWLKKVFTAKRNTDLLPLARTLVGLCDELSDALLPALKLSPEAVERRWQGALAQLSASSRAVWSDEAQLVWSIWKGQLEAGDQGAAGHAQMMRLAENATEPLVWISPDEPAPYEHMFLEAYGRRRAVLPILLDWRASALKAAYAAAWPETLEAADKGEERHHEMTTPENLRLLSAESMEAEAGVAAQAIIDWLAAGKTSVAVVAQDRMAARRLRALLERAGIAVADETGWKLSTSRAASFVNAWFDVVSSRAETSALLDLLKSPYIASGRKGRDRSVMTIEVALRNRNINGGWDAIRSALQPWQEETEWITEISAAAGKFAASRRTPAEWVEATLESFGLLGAAPALEADTAGAQLMALLDMIRRSCGGLGERLSFAEWRAFAGMEMESANFVPVQADRRVVMLPLNGTRLRNFDAVLVMGADADNLPSRATEALFFSNAVRAELGLPTRELLQNRQLRDFSGLLHANADVVLSWQSFKNGESNSCSPWIDRLQLMLASADLPGLRRHEIGVPAFRFSPDLMKPPKPAAPHLLPERISASAYNSLTFCPYQFFAVYMLKLNGFDDISDMPEKRDYGNWLHEILYEFHETITTHRVPAAARLAKLMEISERRFEREMGLSAAALGYYMRWLKAMPAYAAWVDLHEKEGWRYEAGEQKRERRISFDGGETVFHGRIDRIDRNAAGEYSVMDYKTTTLDALKRKLRDKEDHQLAFYGLLFDRPVDHAHYVALEARDGKTGAVAATDYPQWRDGVGARALATLSALSKGASLPANGVQSVCGRCDARGLCRKGAW